MHLCKVVFRPHERAPEARQLVCKFVHGRLFLFVKESTFVYRTKKDEWLPHTGSFSWLYGKFGRSWSQNPSRIAHDW
jgi:hypothetical protein